MEVHYLSQSVVERIVKIEDGMRSAMLWNVTDVLLAQERAFNAALRAIEVADMELLTRGVKRTEDVRKQLSAAMEALRAL